MYLQSIANATSITLTKPSISELALSTLLQTRIIVFIPSAIHSISI